MPYTIVYTEAPRCAYCGRPMESWIAFAEVHYHDECQARLFSERIQAKLQSVVNTFKPKETTKGDEMNDIQAAAPSPEEVARRAALKAEDQRRQLQIAAAKDDAGISSDMLDHACAIIAEGLTTGNYNIRSLLYCVIRDALKEHARPAETRGEPKQ